MPGPRPKYVIEFTTPQVAALTHVSASDTAPFAHVQRARILLLAHQRPDWNNHQSAQGVASCVETMRVWRPRRPQEPTRADRPRVWATGTVPSPMQTQMMALACIQPPTTATCGNGGVARNSPRWTWSRGSSWRSPPAPSGVGGARTASILGTIMPGRTRRILTLSRWPALCWPLWPR
jgi:hypothetical protein